jgi:hypothetical protein
MAITILETGMEVIKPYMLGVGLKVHVESVVWLVIRRLIVAQVETSLQGSKVQRPHLVLKLQHPPQVTHGSLKVQEEVIVLDSRVHAIIVSGLVTKKHNVSISLEISETLPMQQLLVVWILVIW